jgi:N-acyl-D-aspartate/D-glutamate deacylase
MESLSMTDVLITGGRIIDGTGNAWFYGDVALSGLSVSPHPARSTPHQLAP